MVPPRWERMCKIYNKALVTKCKDMVTSHCYQLKYGSIVSNTHMKFSSMRLGSRLFLLVVLNYNTKRAMFLIRSQAGLIWFRMQMIMTSTIVWHIKKICLLWILSTTSGSHDVFVNQNFNSPLTSRAKQLPTTINTRVVYVNFQTSAKTIIVLICAQPQQHRPW